MNWDTLLWIVLIVVGAALVMGGIVAYRGSTRTGVRALAAAGIAAGVMMLAIVALTVPVSVETSTSGTRTTSLSADST